MVVVCPKCKIRLKVDEGKLKVEGSRFKCPKCSTFLLVKKPVAVTKKAMDNNKVLIAHSNPAVINEITSLLTKNGYQTITASDGIDAMIKAIKELPFLTIIEVSLPKIYGFEVCKRLKLRAETKEMKFMLVTSVYDKKRYKREPASLYDADEYIEDHQISELLTEKINKIRGIKPEEKEKKLKKPPEEPVMEKIEQKAEVQIKPEAITGKPLFDEKIERAKRLARTIMSDIYLYNTAKADESIRNNNFYSVFVAEIKEGLKLYENRISQEVRAQGDFFREAIENFIANKKKIL
ncbi:MAG: response regulator [Nitrospirota bacterium]|nr:response regulator [Nitrospirota bacterium]